MAYGELDSNYIRTMQLLSSREADSEYELYKLLEEEMIKKFGHNHHLDGLKMKPKPPKIKQDIPNEHLPKMNSPQNVLDMDFLDEDLKCFICRDITVTFRNQLMECRQCHLMFHQNCHEPPIQEVEVGKKWTCSSCRNTLSTSSELSSTGSTKSSPKSRGCVDEMDRLIKAALTHCQEPSPSKPKSVIIEQQTTEGPLKKVGGKSKKTNEKTTREQVTKVTSVKKEKSKLVVNRKRLNKNPKPSINNSSEETLTGITMTRSKSSAKVVNSDSSNKKPKPKRKPLEKDILVPKKNLPKENGEQSKSLNLDSKKHIKEGTTCTKILKQISISKTKFEAGVNSAGVPGGKRNISQKPLNSMHDRNTLQPPPKNGGKRPETTIQPMRIARKCTNLKVYEAKLSKLESKTILNGTRVVNHQAPEPNVTVGLEKETSFSPKQTRSATRDMFHSQRSGRSEPKFASEFDFFSTPDKNYTDVPSEMIEGPSEAVEELQAKVKPITSPSGASNSSRLTSSVATSAEPVLSEVGTSTGRNNFATGPALNIQSAERRLMHMMKRAAKMQKRKRT